MFVIPARNFKAVCEVDDFERSPETVAANARLIAAAPDLLAALQYIVGFDDVSDLIVDIAAKAITKATAPPVGG